MTPILGIIASSNFRVPTAYESIATTTVGSGGTATITFSSIPATYTHLQLRILARTDRAAVTDFAKLQFNTDTTTNYSIHGLEGNGATASAYGVASQNNVNVYRYAGASATASVFGVSVIDILDYALTTKYKTVRCLGGADNNGSGVLGLASGAWLSTSAVNRIDLTAGIGTSFSQYSSFALYGIK
jgi:hypothetical protein